MDAVDLDQDQATSAPEDGDCLSQEAVATRRAKEKHISQVVFSVRALYGLSRASVPFPLNETESIESGQICVSIDPDADPSGNAGIIDYDTGKLTVRYGVQAIFPGLFQLVTEGKFDPGLLNPVRAVATDECSLTEDLSGWRALGCLDFLPGSIWAGAQGG